MTESFTSEAVLADKGYDSDAFIQVIQRGGRRHRARIHRLRAHVSPIRSLPKLWWASSSTFSKPAFM